MHKVVIDTNVILSAILFGGKPALLIDGIQKQKFAFCISEKLYEEVFEKLTNKFLVDTDILNEVSTIFSHGVLYSPTVEIHLPQDQDDEYLLELTESCKADYLITGDKKHLLPLNKWKSTKIISPSDAIDILL